MTAGHIRILWQDTKKLADSRRNGVLTPLSAFPRKRESSYFNSFWIPVLLPAFAGVRRNDDYYLQRAFFGSLDGRPPCAAHCRSSRNRNARRTPAFASCSLTAARARSR